jgi:hypothetical protein
MLGDEGDEVGHLAPGDVVPHPGIYDLLLGGVRRHPGSRANDCLAWNDGIELAASPEDGQTPCVRASAVGHPAVEVYDRLGQDRPGPGACPEVIDLVRRQVV